jgi:RNA polymerase sigma-70 factor (ECF subfamily)
MDETSDAAGFVTGGSVSREAPDPSDESLVTSVREGNEVAFQVLFERHRRAVAGIAGRFFRHREQIEDIIQESFTKAYLSLGDYRGERERSFASWLARIAVNSCYDELRRAKRRPEIKISELTEDETAWLERRLHSEGPVARLEETAVSRDLATKLLARLAPADRLVLTLLNIEDRSVAEVSELTGWSAANVKVRAHRARKTLRRLLRRFL